MICLDKKSLFRQSFIGTRHEVQPPPSRSLIVNNPNIGFITSSADDNIYWSGGESESTQSTFGNIASIESSESPQGSPFQQEDNSSGGFISSATSAIDEQDQIDQDLEFYLNYCEGEQATEDHLEAFVLDSEQVEQQSDKKWEQQIEHLIEEEQLGEGSLEEKTVTLTMTEMNELRLFMQQMTNSMNGITSELATVRKQIDEIKEGGIGGNRPKNYWKKPLDDSYAMEVAAADEVWEQKVEPVAFWTKPIGPLDPKAQFVIRCGIQVPNPRNLLLVSLHLLKKSLRIA